MTQLIPDGERGEFIITREHLNNLNMASYSALQVVLNSEARQRGLILYSKYDPETQGMLIRWWEYRE